MPELRKILVPVDFSAASRAALEYAVFLASALDATVDVLHVWQTPASAPPESAEIGLEGVRGGIGPAARRAAEQDLGTMLAPHHAAHPKVEGRVEFGVPAVVILSAASERPYDLIVIGTRGRTGLSRVLLGSVSDRVVHGAQCPVLVVRSPPEGAPARER